MTGLVELFPNAQPNRWVTLERIVETIEAQSGEFTLRDIMASGANYATTYEVVREFQRFGLVQRVNGTVRPAVYRTLPTAVAS